MISLSVVMTAAEGKGDELEKAFAKIVPQVKQNEPGNLMYVVLRDTKNESKFHVWEQYKSKEDMDKHVASNHYKEFAKVVPGLVAGRPEVNFCRPVA